MLFKDTEIGKIPEHWQISPLEEYAEVLDPHPSHRAPKAVENGLPFVGIGDLDAYGSADFSKARKVSEEVISEHESNYMINSHSIGYAKMGNTIGKVVSFPERRGDCRYAVSPALSIINPKDNINPFYLRAIVESRAFFEQVSGRITGSTRPSIGIQLLRKILIPVPSKKEQDLIGEYWYNIYRLIQVNNTICEKLEAQAKELFFKKFGEVTEGAGSIGEYVKLKRGKNLLSKDAIPGDVPVVAGGLSPATYHNASNTEAPVLTVSASGANAGYVALWERKVWSSDSSFLDTSCSTNVYFWYVMLKTRQKEIFDLQTGSAQPHIYPQNIENMKVCELKELDMQEYNEEVSSMFKMIGKKREEIKKLERLRDVMLPKIISGDVDILSLYAG